MLRTKRGRGFKAYKGCIFLFIGVASKAIHLKVVSDLTSAAFIAAFKRFTSRRVACVRLCSDSGTTFRGADRELTSMYKAASRFYSESAEMLASEGTTFEFIPPSAAHFGKL